MSQLVAALKFAAEVSEHSIVAIGIEDASILDQIV